MILYCKGITNNLFNLTIDINYHKITTHPTVYFVVNNKTAD